MITSNSFLYLLENDKARLLENYHKIKPSDSPTFYHKLVPFHSNGLLKSEIDYKEYFKFDNININHFTSYLNHGDKHEYEKNVFLIKSLNGRPTIHKTNYTIIYGITVSKPTAQIIREIESLSHEEAAFVIFYDNKSNRTNLYKLFEKQELNDKLKNVYLVDSPRFHVEWARITQAFTQIVMNVAAIKFFPNSLYVSFHSESDYPIVPSGKIINFLRRNYPNNYIQSLYDRSSQWKHVRRESFSFSFNDLNVIEKMIRFLFPKKIMPFANWTNGWNWFTMNLNDSKILIDTLFKRFDIVDALEFCKYSDEIIFSTLVNEAKIKSTNEFLRYVDWRTKDAHPVVFIEKNFNDLINHRCSLWARKFAIGTSNKVLDMIDVYLKNYPKNKEFIC